MTFHQELINNCNTFTSNPVQCVEMEEDKVWCDWVSCTFYL